MFMTHLPFFRVLGDKTHSQEHGWKDIQYVFIELKKALLHEKATPKMPEMIGPRC